MNFFKAKPTFQILGQDVTEDELRVLRALNRLRHPAAMPRIAIHVQGKEISGPKLNRLLDRLHSVQLVTRDEKEILVQGHTLKRVTWSVPAEVRLAVLTIKC